MASDHHIPALMYGDHVGDESVGWRSVGSTPSSSPFEFFVEGAFPDSDSGAPYTFNGPMDDTSCTVSTALGDQLGDISLYDSAAPYTCPVPPSQLDCVSGTGHKSGWPGYSGGFDRGNECPTRPLTDPAGGRIPRHGHGALYPIETSLRPGPMYDRPLSGISDPSTINSTPINSSCSDASRSREIIWPHGRPAPYPISSPRKRSSSVCHPGGAHAVDHPSRKRSSSDAYLGDAASDSLATPRNPDAGFLELPVNTPFDTQSTWPSDWVTRSTTSSIDFSAQIPNGYPTDLTPAGPSQNVDFSWAHGHPHSPGTRMMGGFNQSNSSPLSPQPHSPNEDANQVIRPQVASEAVMKAAMKKRKNHDGKVFTCDICCAELTTKQNLQYHISAHKGIRDYSCDTCKKSFGTPHVRNRHQQRCRN